MFAHQASGSSEELGKIRSIYRIGGFNRRDTKSSVLRGIVRLGSGQLKKETCGVDSQRSTDLVNSGPKIE